MEVLFKDTIEEKLWVSFGHNENGFEEEIVKLLLSYIQICGGNNIATYRVL